MKPRFKIRFLVEALRIMIPYGVFISAILIFVGLSLKIIGLGPVHQETKDIIQTILSGKVVPREISVVSESSILERIINFDPDSVMMLGISLLVFLPILRLVMIGMIFFYEGDWLFWGVSLFVLTILLSANIFGLFFH